MAGTSDAGQIFQKNLLQIRILCYTRWDFYIYGLRRIEGGYFVMKHIKTLTTRNLKESMKKGGCGECQTSCQSACKTSCTVGNQSCEQVKAE